MNCSEVGLNGQLREVLQCLQDLRSDNACKMGQAVTKQAVFGTKQVVFEIKLVAS